MPCVVGLKWVTLNMRDKFCIRHTDYDSECTFEYEKAGEEIIFKNIVNGGVKRYGTLIVSKIDDKLNYSSDIEGLEMINIKDSPFRKALTDFVDNLYQPQ